MFPLLKNEPYNNVPDEYINKNISEDVNEDVNKDVSENVNEYVYKNVNEDVNEKIVHMSPIFRNFPRKWKKVSHRDIHLSSLLDSKKKKNLLLRRKIL